MNQPSDDDLFGGVFPDLTPHLAPIKPRIVASHDLRRIGGALSQFWTGGSGPTRAQIQAALLIAGYDGSDEGGNKQQLVLNSILRADDPTARRIIEELLNLLREAGDFHGGQHDGTTGPLLGAVTAAGHELTGDGFIRWASTPSTTSGTSPPDHRQPPLLPPESAVGTPQESAPELLRPAVSQEVSCPTLDLLVSSLRRLGTGAVRSLIHRRRAGRSSLTIEDEYDLQDIVEVLLRCLYNDVRDEEPTPSSAGSSSRMDLHLREGQTAVEVKVTAPGRGPKQIKPELLVDINDYRNHPTVETLIAVVYDLAHTFENPAGFEHDLSRGHDGLDVRVLVVPWVGPRAPA